MGYASSRAATAGATLTASVPDVELVARNDGRFLYVIAVRRDPSTTAEVAFHGLPHKNDGTPISGGQVLTTRAAPGFLRAAAPVVRRSWATPRVRRAEPRTRMTLEESRSADVDAGGALPSGRRSAGDDPCFAGLRRWGR